MPILLRNGRVHTPARDDATALVVDGATVSWIGDEDGAAEHPGMQVVDLQHAFVTPAFVDAHVHATSTGLALTGLDLRRATSLAEALRHVETAARTARGRPLLGGGWDDTRWPEQRPPTAAELDRASYGGAVYLARVDVHSAVASSALMAAVPDLTTRPGHRVDGWLRGAAHDAVRTAAQAAITPGQRRDAQRAALRRAAELGIACVHEMAGPVISSEDDLIELLRLAREQALPQVVGYWAELLAVDRARELGAAGAAGDLFCDGSLGSHTAALSRPYADRPDTCGSLRFDTDELAEHVLRCAEAGMQAGFHAIGDAAVDQVLAAVEAASARLGRPAGPGSRLEHAEMVSAPARLAAAGLTASVQPRFDALWGGRHGMYAQRLGRDRARQLNDFAALAAAGVPLAFGSDAPVTELGPWAAVRAAAYPHEPAAAISEAAAFAAHSRGGWQAAGLGEDGVLVPGGAATFAVWRSGEPIDGGRPTVDRSPTLPASDPGRALPNCLATVLRGRVLHDAGLLTEVALGTQ